MFSWLKLQFIFGVLLSTATLSFAQDNAALSKYGANIEVTCKHAKPLNDRWSKPEDMLRDKKPAGPIINDLSTADVTITFPVKVTIEQVGIMFTDQRGSFATPKDIEISAPGAVPVSVTLENTPQKVQTFPFSAQTDILQVKVKSTYPAQKNSKIKYGAINQIKVLVKERMGELFAIPDNVKRGQPVYIMKTSNLDPHAVAEVVGSPRQVDGYPRTIWDKQDIEELKKQIATYPAAKLAYEGCIAFCESVVKNPIEVPSEPSTGVNPAVDAQHTRVASGIANLGIGYALSGNENYAKEAVEMLLKLAEYYEGWPVHGHPQMRHDSSKWNWQRLGDAIWLIQAAWGFDLIYNSPSVTDEQRAKIKEHFIIPCIENILRSNSIIKAPTNWSVICTAAVMIGSRVCDNDKYYNMALYGVTGKPEDMKGGVLFQIDKGLDDDGMWGEGAIHYQFMAMRGFVVMAEILWHDNFNLWGYNNSRLKKIFDSPIWYCYPGGKDSPAIHDSTSASLFGRDAHLYQYALRRYGDKTYNSILAKIKPTFESVYNLFLPACNFSPVNGVDLPRVPSILFPGVGFAISRSGDGMDEKYMMIDYGPNRSHGHPDKLNHCLYALGQELFADAGIAWYTTDIYQRYYKHTIAHNTIAPAGKNQISTGGNLEVFGQSDDITIMRASCDTAIPSTALDRTLVMSGNRLYDIYMCRSGIPFTFELPYHSYGTIKQDITKEVWKEHPKEKNGYAYFKNPLYAKTDKEWACEWKINNGKMTMRSPSVKGTELIFTQTPKGGSDLGTVIVRRKLKDTVFSGVFDIIQNGNDDSIKSIANIQSENGYLLSAELNDGSQDVVIVNYSSEKIQLGGWNTDARVVFVNFKDKKIMSFIVAGGTFFYSPEINLMLSQPSFIAFKEYTSGLGRLQNFGENDTAVTIKGANYTDAVAINNGKIAKITEGAIAVEPHCSYDLKLGNQISVDEYIAKLRKDKMQDLIEKENKQREDLLKEVKSQKELASAVIMPEGLSIILQAEAFKDQGGGTLRVANNKTASYGDALSGWDNNNHWIEYEFNVKNEGFYQLFIKYCREGDETSRSIYLDGKLYHPSLKDVTFASTGGWANGSDNWAVRRIEWPLVNKPFLFKLTKGKHLLKLDSPGGGGLNLDYIVFLPSGIKFDKHKVEKE